MSYKRKLPNFLIVGTMRCGTSSLYHYLRSHPQIYLSDIKEPGFLVADYLRHIPKEDPRYDSTQKRILNFQDYQNLFRNHSDEKCIGEATTACLILYESSIKNIKKYLGDIKIIIGLRDPIPRALSNYNYIVKLGFDNNSLAYNIEMENYRLKNNWDPIWAIKKMGFYHEHVNAFVNEFSDVYIYNFDEFVNNTQKIYTDILSFLQVEKVIPRDINLIFNRSSDELNLLGKVANQIVSMKNKYKLTWIQEYDFYYKIRDYICKHQYKKPKKNYMDSIDIDDLFKEYKDELTKINNLLADMNVRGLK